MIKAIETKYSGYRFRSRLEARWAVFFDALGLEWEYEPEGFELPGTGRYLPDFYVVDLKLWVEVKPVVYDAEYEYRRWYAFVRSAQRSLLIATGVPDLREYEIIEPYRADDTWFEDEQQERLAKQRGCVSTTACFNSKYLPPNPHDREPRLFYLPGDVSSDADCIDAVEKAKSARFEYGETPDGNFLK